jgi:hypothetical protein
VIKIDKLMVLDIGSHADPFDMAFIRGGTLAKYAKWKHSVVMGSVCGGNTEERR